MAAAAEPLNELGSWRGTEVNGLVAAEDGSWNRLSETIYCVQPLTVRVRLDDSVVTVALSEGKADVAPPSCAA